ncbi:MAG: ATP-dependent zinc metalloprotease FtsH, partial [bacterium]
KSPQKFNDIGARIPKGILLVGPPGTGKTLLARAVAGEAGVQFFTISGSDFVEMFVGVGASRVREMFEEAKNHKPCLIFIDEIDAVGRRRGSGLGGGHDEREQTLNQLLVEMDGFTSNEGIIILAATNRVDILDPALLRPGRFDRQIYVGAPDVKGREEILNVHAKTKVIDSKVNLKDIAKTTAGFTGAELENLLNEAAIIAAKKDKKCIYVEDLEKAFIKVGIGTEKKSRVTSLEERKITAYHEAGHAILAEALPLIDSVHIISIIPTGPAGGYTMHLPVDKGYISKTYFYQDIMSLYGGRIAEELIFDEITTGASSDIERASRIARAMVTKYGMSELGAIDIIEDHISQELSSSIDKEISKILKECYEDATRILQENLEYLHSCAEILLEKEKISGDEFREIFPENYFPKKPLPTFDPKDLEEQGIEQEEQKQKLEQELTQNKKEILSDLEELNNKNQDD